MSQGSGMLCWSRISSSWAIRADLGSQSGSTASLSGALGRALDGGAGGLAGAAEGAFWARARLPREDRPRLHRPRPKRPESRGRRLIVALLVSGLVRLINLRAFHGNAKII